MSTSSKSSKQPFSFKKVGKIAEGNSVEENSSKKSEVVSNDDTLEKRVSNPTKETKSIEIPDATSLSPLFNLISERGYKNEALVGIDQESHEFLSLMKRKLGVKQYALVSYLIQEFYEKHEDELIELLSEKKDRKFLNI